MAGLSLSNSSFGLGVTPKFNEREDYFSSSIVKEINTYSTWDEMKLVNDVVDINYTVIRLCGPLLSLLTPRRDIPGSRRLLSKCF